MALDPTSCLLIDDDILNFSLDGEDGDLDDEHNKPKTLYSSLDFSNPNSQHPDDCSRSFPAGCGLGGMLSAFDGLNTGMPYIQKHVKGPRWLPFVIGALLQLLISYHFQLVHCFYHFFNGSVLCVQFDLTTLINHPFPHIPPLLMFSAAGAAFGGYGLPNFTQLSVTSYYAASSASHYGISLITRYIEDTYTSCSQQQRLG